jgi:hypothetical protein
MPRRRAHRLLFCVAGIYNIAWGLHAVLDPEALFRFAAMPLPSYPEMWASVGMIVGLYGIVFLEVARRPEQGFVLAAVGLTGKILGPIGWAGLVLAGRWPLSTVILVLANDLVWWYPFSRYLRDAWPHLRRELAEGARGRSRPPLHR